MQKMMILERRQDAVQVKPLINDHDTMMPAILVGWDHDEKLEETKTQKTLRSRNTSWQSVPSRPPRTRQTPLLPLFKTECQGDDDDDDQNWFI